MKILSMTPQKWIGAYVGVGSWYGCVSYSITFVLVVTRHSVDLVAHFHFTIFFFLENQFIISNYIQSLHAPSYIT